MSIPPKYHIIGCISHDISIHIPIIDHFCWYWPPFTLLCAPKLGSMVHKPYITGDMWLYIVVYQTYPLISGTALQSRYDQFSKQIRNHQGIDVYHHKRAESSQSYYKGTEVHRKILDNLVNVVISISIYTYIYIHSIYLIIYMYICIYIYNIYIIYIMVHIIYGTIWSWYGVSMVIFGYVWNICVWRMVGWFLTPRALVSGFPTDHQPTTGVLSAVSAVWQTWERHIAITLIIAPSFCRVFPFNIIDWNSSYTCDK